MILASVLILFVLWLAVVVYVAATDHPDSDITVQVSSGPYDHESERS